MAFVDELTIEVSAGNGGDGVVRWRHEKFKPKGGPSGGDGGRGGDVYVRAVRDIGRLSKYRHNPIFQAEHGEDGGSNSKHGKSGEPLFIELPVGSVIRNTQDVGSSIELLEDGSEILLLKGGQGGFGNERFKSSTNQQPQEHTVGKKGESGVFDIEIQIVADAGFVGFPNAGKSSLLNALTNADAKVGDYAFTTLDPNLGEMYGYILADIPGLIEGASGGKGLGHKFLRHIARTRLILHTISLEESNPEKAYLTVRNELEAYGHALTDKREVIVLTKADLLSDEEADKVADKMRHYTSDVYIVSILVDETVKSFRDALIAILRGE